MGNVTMSSFPYNESTGVGGLFVTEKPMSLLRNGANVYLNGGKDLAVVLERMEGAGGQVMMGKTKISDEIGYFAIFADTAGNQLSLHSPS